MTAYQKAEGLLRGWGLGLKIKYKYRTKHTSRQQHSMVATQHNNNMVATQHGSSTKHVTNIIGHRQPHKGQEGRDNNTSCNSEIGLVLQADLCCLDPVWSHSWMQVVSACPPSIMHLFEKSYTNPSTCYHIMIIKQSFSFENMNLSAFNRFYMYTIVLCLQ